MKLGKSTATTVDQCLLKSDKALTIFHDVIKKLTKANDELIEARNQDLEEQSHIANNIQRAEWQENKNNELIKKISNIIEV